MPLAFAGSLFGCASMGKSTRPEGIYLHNGYYAENESARMDMTLAAGIAAGTVKVEKTENGYYSSGSFSQAMNPEIFDKVCRVADVNQNDFIEDEEARKVVMDLYEIVTKNG